jgi:hypothetical protein
MAQELDQSAANYRYILRYLIDPHRDAGERLEELVGFCREARIDEVMLLLQTEELSAGHPTRREWAGGDRIPKKADFSVTWPFFSTFCLDKGLYF